MKKRDKKLLLEIETLVTQEKNNKELVALERGFYRKIKDEMKDLNVRIYELWLNGQRKEANKLSSELNKIEENLKILVLYRLRKILKFVSWKNNEIKNMTPEELQLFTDIRQAIEIFENQVFGREESPESKPPTHEEETLKIAEKDEIVKDSSSAGETQVNKLPSKDETEVLVRVKAHVGRFILPGDVVYNLRKEDVLFLPEKVYKILYKADKVEKIRIHSNE